MGLAIKNPRDPAELPCRYGVSKVFDQPFALVTAKLDEALAGADLTIAFRHDLSEQLAAKIGSSYPPYLIWGVARNDDLLRALAAEPQIGLLFPCHLIAYENHRQQTVIMAVDPAHFMDVLRHPAAIQAAIEMKDLLEELVEKL